MSEMTDTKSIAEHFAEQAQRRPTAPALVAIRAASAAVRFTTTTWGLAEMV